MLLEVRGVRGVRGVTITSEDELEWRADSRRSAASLTPASSYTPLPSMGAPLRLVAGSSLPPPPPPRPPEPEKDVWRDAASCACATPGTLSPAPCPVSLGMRGVD